MIEWGPSDFSSLIRYDVVLTSIHLAQGLGLEPRSCFRNGTLTACGLTIRLPLNYSDQSCERFNLILADRRVFYFISCYRDPLKLQFALTGHEPVYFWGGLALFVLRPTLCYEYLTVTLDSVRLDTHTIRPLFDVIPHGIHHSILKVIENLGSTGRTRTSILRVNSSSFYHQTTVE